ncbi:MAG TPA: ASKHA domain-containing protein [Fimbriimonas sp.]
MRLELELPEGLRTINLDRAEKGQRLTEILRREGIPLNTRCGERDLCKSCTVEVLRDGEWVEMRGCQLRVVENLQIRAPQQSLLAYKPQIQSDYRVNIPYADDPLLGKVGYGIAVDIGTTTVSLSAIALEGGEIKGRAAAFNKQMHLGDDVLTRINLCYTDRSKIVELQRAIVDETLIPLVAQAMLEAGVSVEEVRGYTVAGNTTMLHLLLGEDPSSLGVAPFTPLFIGHTVVDSESIGLEPPGVPVHCLPGASAYVGADITSGVLATGLLYEDGPSLLVDVGTNGEIVFKHGGRMLGTATAAGPAFEGSGLTNGIRAGEGAVGHIWMRRDPFEMLTEVIGPPRTKPVGVCGSAYIDFLAQGHGAGILSASGRIQAEKLPEDLLDRDEYGSRLIVGRGQGKRKVTISEPDIARLLQAKAAIAAGILILLKRVGVEPEEVETLYLAGGFGMHLNLENAVACGLFPGFRPEQIQLVGNTSLAGATLSMIDRSALPELRRAGEEIEIVELNLDPDFEDTYIDQLVIGDC